MRQTNPPTGCPDQAGLWASSCLVLRTNILDFQYFVIMGILFILARDIQHYFSFHFQFYFKKLFFPSLFNNVNQNLQCTGQFWYLALIIYTAVGFPEVPKSSWQFPVVMFDLFQVDCRLICNQNNKRHLECNLFIRSYFKQSSNGFECTGNRRMRYPKLLFISSDPHDKNSLKRGTFS